MKTDIFGELLASANEALEHAKGKRDLRTTVLPAPPKPMNARDVRALRARLKASQAVFASYLNVSAKLVQAWEADRRTPEGAALRLMRIAETAPQLLVAGLERHGRTSAAGKRANGAARRSEPAGK